MTIKPFLIIVVSVAVQPMFTMQRVDTQPYLDGLNNPKLVADVDDEGEPGGLTPKVTHKVLESDHIDQNPELPCAQVTVVQKQTKLRFLRNMPELYLPYIKEFNEHGAFRKYIVEAVTAIMTNHQTSIAYIVLTETLSDDERLNFVRARLNEGEDPNIPLTDSKVTALHLAVARGDVAMVTLLCQPAFIRNRDAMLKNKKLKFVPDNRARLMSDIWSLDPRHWAYMLFVHQDHHALLGELDNALMCYNRR